MLGVRAVLPFAAVTVAPTFCRRLEHYVIWGAALALQHGWHGWPWGAAHARNWRQQLRGFGSSLHRPWSRACVRGGLRGVERDRDVGSREYLLSGK